MFLSDILALCGFLYLHIWIHEIGHAVVGRAVGYEVTSLGTGRGKPLLAWSWRGLRLFICRLYVFSGVTFVFSKSSSMPRRQKVLMSAGGIIANFLTACVLGAILLRCPESRICWIAFGTVWPYILGSIIPYRNAPGSIAKRNDAAIIIDALFPRKAPVEPSSNWLTTYLPLLEFLRGVGDERGLSRYGASIVPALLYYQDLDLKSVKKLAGWIAPNELSDLKYRFECILLRARLALAEDDSQMAGEALDEAEKRYLAEYGENYEFSLQWMRFAWLLKVERPEEALRIIDTLIARYPIEKHAEIAVSLLTCRLHAVLDLHGLSEGLKIYEEYRQKRSLHLSSALDLNVAHALGKAYGKSDDWKAAEPYYREALALVQKLGSLPRSDKELIEDAQTCFEHLGFTDDPELVQTKDAISRSVKEKRVVDKKETHLKDLIQGNASLAFGCILVCLLVFAMAYSEGTGVDFGTYLSKFSLVAAFVIVPVCAYGNHDRGFRPFAGPIIIALTVLPWVAAALIVHSV